jgi:aspartyl-tRNA(Asn)/glutamyl-tRNA(Gln) amidotransferase subunit A
MAATRDAGFGDEAKRRIILGTYACPAATTTPTTAGQKVRTLISRDFDRRVRRRPTLLVSPTAPTTAFESALSSTTAACDVPQRHRHDPANLAGVPGIVVPSGLADEDGCRRRQCSRPPRPTTGSTRSARARGAARSAWGGPLLTRRPTLEGRRADRPEEGGRHDARPYDEAAARFDPVIGPRGAR